MNEPFLYLKKIGIDTHQHAVVFMRKDNHVCRAEGFNSMNRVRVCLKNEKDQEGQKDQKGQEDQSIIATLITVSDDFLSHQEAGLSDFAWQLLNAQDGQKAHFSHAPAVESMSYVRGKLYGEPFTDEAAKCIVHDIKSGNYSDVQLAAFVAACADDRLDLQETIAITRAMVESGQRFDWSPKDSQNVDLKAKTAKYVLDKHCVGGLPGNRTTPIVTAIIAANGLVMPKTSSRAITSPAGTADTMETMTNVSLSFEHMRSVVATEGACLAWGGSVSLSPTDDIVIRVERALDLDSEGQLVASVISKKVAAGSNKVLIDVPVGPTAKVRTHRAAKKLCHHLSATGAAMGIEVVTHTSDGTQPVGRGIGPALEAHDVLAVLRNEPDAPIDLRNRSLQLAAELLQMAELTDEFDRPITQLAACYQLAERTLNSMAAYDKFLAICEAQGGFKEPGVAEFQHEICAEKNGIVTFINNRFIARLASLAGAPNAPLAGLTIHVRLGDKVEVGQPLMTLHSMARGELEYALSFYQDHPEALNIDKEIL